ncbi:hypothetical protein HRR83_007995 [Exophiala dermatitidis]|uniref:SET domain-containing protein n=2 Tax=Exophiala dermatitidis TaxID=5970 RepID=H6BPG3_EXODN|nr:uncharacterized protein HMPREF1120_02591 [Exophiala dermatitidis NIH/UT8656]KAJ4502131.1 hypothetical protein HRR75_008608 [Exophiala dermatitidis]EHY54422.1 hypothetical protein HMPREF1120_02591 [Exophiala dermatitidis NIH/UT8656]KAJ4502698.1 hypothetical protein HRR73_009352 [Exophiala dermatitidis]KAJ4503236.1 hypothetical protein HRR74_009360 [Exophiala dermatitidis]KAJ4535802.1 hypothetical protein HRR77_007746 [Exophiala dermatitidis]
MSAHPRQAQRQTKASSSQLPKNWPPDIVYLTTLHIPPPLSSSVLEVIAAPTGFSTANSLPIIKPQAIISPNPLVRITPITSPSHPAQGQYGLFSTRALPPSSFVILYLGTLHGPAQPPDTSTDEADSQTSQNATASSSSSTSTPPSPDSTYATSNYDLSLDRDLDLAIDASKCGNEARFINDYRGIRPAGPNAEFRDCLVQVGGPGTGTGKLEKRIGVFVLSAGKNGGPRAKGIGKGEEIVVSYGKGFWNARKDE